MRGVLRLRQVSSATGLRPETIVRGMQQKWFPKAEKIGPRAVGWKAADIVAWNVARSSGRLRLWKHGVKKDGKL